MSGTKSELAHLAGDVRATLAWAHLRSQAVTFAAAVMAALAVQVQAGAPVTGWTDVWALGSGAVITAVRQVLHQLEQKITERTILAGGLPVAPAAPVPASPRTPDPPTAPPRG